MTTKTTSFTDWAYNHTDNTHPKYNTLSHSLTITLKNTFIFVVTSLAIRYYFYPSHLQDHNPQYELHSAAPYVGVFLLIYLIFMIASRYHENGPIAIY